jgi:hypothetical protein
VKERNAIPEPDSWDESLRKAGIGLAVGALGGVFLFSLKWTWPVVLLLALSTAGWKLWTHWRWNRGPRG